MILPFGFQIIAGDWVFEECKPDGTFKGKNSFGAQATVRRISCKRLELHDSAIMSASFSKETSIPMSPSEYRAITKSNPWVEVDFEVGAKVEQEVFAAGDYSWAATFSSPTEKRVRIVNAYGRFKRINILSSDAKKVLGSFDRMPEDE